MMRTLDLRGSRPSRADLLKLVPRAAVAPHEAEAAAAGLVRDVAERGAIALAEQSDRFDGGRPPVLRVPADEIAEAVSALDPAVRDAIVEAIARVRTASAAQVPPPALSDLGAGARVEQRWLPVARVGLYVPGGKAVYPSSVVMNVVPAQVAGVASIALASPPQRAHGGRVHPVVLGTAGLLEVEEVYAMGGAGAVGAFAHGVADAGLEPVDVVTGPGNVYVAAAKRVVRGLGLVGIDSEAGPTEILVIADGSADARLVAADLVSQAEHDEIAAALLVTDAPGLADAVRECLDELVPATRHSDRVRTALDGPQSAIVLVPDLDAAAAFSNAYAPEHLEIQTADPDAVLGLIVNAGAVFVGRDAPVSLGDYLAGSNHVLPTGGQARSSAALGTATFLRSQQVIRYDREGLAGVRAHVRALADAEELPGHGDAVDARFA
jgi:histidinol dehydrogenase